MIRKIIKIIIVLLCMITIFMFSSDSAEKSDKKSDNLIIGVCNIFVGHNLSEKEKRTYIDKFVVLVRKTAHYTIYLLLGLSIISLIKEYKNLDIKTILIALLISILYAISDEIHQLFVPGRSGEVLDILIDSLGSLTGIYIYYLIYKIRRNKNEQEKAIS